MDAAQIESGRHDLTVDIGAGPTFLDADLTRLAHLVSNLLNKAAKYTPDGGQITLTARAGGQ